MAHEIEIINGVASHFFVGETPWHGLGQGLNNPPSIAEGIKLAGLDWKVEKRPLFCQGFSTEQVPFAEGNMPWETRIPTEHVAIVRVTDNRVLGVLKNTYEPVQNSEAFEFFQPLIEQGFVSLETAGSLRGGSRVWVMAKINNTTHDIVNGDPVNAYFLLSNSHDGTLAVRVGFTGIRVVCQNTLSLAHHNQSSRLIKVKHTKNVAKGLEKIRETVDWQRQTFAATAEQMRAMARVGVDTETLERYVEQVFMPEISKRPVNEAKGEEEIGESREKSVAKLCEKIIPLFENGRGNNMPGVRGTLWAAYNAVTEYQTWERGREVDTRLESLWFGQNAKTNERAFDVAMEFVAKAA